ncbi:MAG: hypothetical protein ACO3EM_06985 [Ilumatobacteraceae bacterium]
MSDTTSNRVKSSHRGGHWGILATHSAHVRKYFCNPKKIHRKIARESTTSRDANAMLELVASPTSSPYPFD